MTYPEAIAVLIAATATTAVAINCLFWAFLSYRAATREAETAVAAIRTAESCLAGIKDALAATRKAVADEAAATEKAIVDQHSVMLAAIEEAEKTHTRPSPAGRPTKRNTIRDLDI